MTSAIVHSNPQVAHMSKEMVPRAGLMYAFMSLAQARIVIRRHI